MKTFGISISISVFLILLIIPVSYSGTQDKWEQCTGEETTKQAAGETYVCCSGRWEKGLEGNKCPATPTPAPTIPAPTKPTSCPVGTQKTECTNIPCVDDSTKCRILIFRNKDCQKDVWYLDEKCVAENDFYCKITFLRCPEKCGRWRNDFVREYDSCYPDEIKSPGKCVPQGPGTWMIATCSTNACRQGAYQYVTQCNADGGTTLTIKCAFLTECPFPTPPVDTTPPTTTATATSPPRGASYTLGDSTKSDVEIILSCSDNLGGSGCKEVRYCTGSATCNPTVATTRFNCNNCDSTGDGCFSSADTDVVACFGKSVTGACTNRDVNNDGVINIGDITMCSSNCGCPAPTATSEKVTLKAEGTTNLRYQSVDNAGNPESVKSQQVTIDKTPPDTIIDGGPSGVVPSKDATFTFSSTEAVSSFQCKVDAGSFFSCSSPKLYSLLSERFHTFEVKASDVAGNTDPTPAARGWTVDTKPPATNIFLSGTLGNSGWYKSNVQVTLTCSDPLPGSGCKEVRYCIGDVCEPNADSTPATSETIPISSEGTFTIRYYSVDNAGNPEAEQSRTIKIDKTSPTISAFSVSPAAPAWVKANQDVTISWTVSDTGSSNLDRVEIWRETNGVGDWAKVKTISAPLNSNSWSSSTTHSPENGVFRYGIIVVDKAENLKHEWEAGFSVVKVQVDKDLPSISAFSVSPAAPAWVKANQDVTISWTVSDTGSSNLDRVEIWRETNGVGDWAKVKTISAPLNSNSWSSSTTHSPENGVFRYGIIVVDKAENLKHEWEAGFNVVKVQVDKTPPTCSVSSMTESSDFAHVSGTTIFYSTASSGSFQVGISSTDTPPGSGVKKVNFPTTASNGGDDTTSPYSWSYNWDTADTFDASTAATCSDNADNPATTTFTVNRDVTPPSGGSISYTDGYYRTTNVAITLATGTDSESGVNTVSDFVERQEATLSSGSCGAFGAWAKVKDNPDASWTDATVVNSKCYKYRYIVSDNVKNPVTYTSTSTAKVDTSQPTGSISINSGATFTKSASVTLTLSCSDPESGCSKMKISNTLTGVDTAPEENFATSKAWLLTSGGGTKTVFVKFIDAARNPMLSAVPDDIFLDPTAPTSATVDTPIHNTRYNAATLPTIFSGKARDNAGGSGLDVNSVTFYIKRSSDNNFWTGSAWTGTLTWLSATHSSTTGDTEITWTNTASLPVWTDGIYFAKARAIDKAGNPFEGSEILFVYDTTPPVRSKCGTTEKVTISNPTLSLTTDESATCKQMKLTGTTGVSYDNPSMITMQNTGGTAHSQPLSGLTPEIHRYDVKCKDSVDNKNLDDCVITFDICIRSNPTVAITSPTPPVHEGTPGQKKEYTVQVTNNNQNCGTEPFDLTIIGCPTGGWTCTLKENNNVISSLSIASGSSKSATLSITSSPSAAAGVNVITVEAKNRADVSFKGTAFATYVVICAPSVSIKQMPNFNTATKEGEAIGIRNTWTVSFTDSSSTSCSVTSSYDITSPIDETKLFFTSGSCHTLTGLYTAATKQPPAGTKLTMATNKVSITRGGELNNALNVFVERNGPNSCTLSFVLRVGGKTIDPSFKVSPATGGGDQSPHVSLFDFSGDKEAFNVNWEAFYPDEPFRKMEVKCGLNCDPRILDPGALGACTEANEKCEPYPVKHGSEEIKKGSCSVASPAFSFSTDKIMCLFYDPDKPEFNTFVNHDFTAVDFDIITPNEITATVGDRFDLKIDVGNKGTLKDSYKIELSGTENIDISPTTITTPTINLNQILSTVSSIMPLVDQSGEVTVKVTSLTSGKVVTRNIKVSPGLFVLPEFGLIGFLQIIAIAAMLYFLLVNRMKSKKRRR